MKAQETQPVPAAPEPSPTEVHLQEELARLEKEKEELLERWQTQVRDNGQLSQLNQEQEERLQELEKALQRYGEEAVDKQQILENMQSDKATISRAITQNRELKEQLAELQNGFVKLVRFPPPHPRPRHKSLDYDRNGALCPKLRIAEAGVLLNVPNLNPKFESQLFYSSVRLFIEKIFA